MTNQRTSTKYNNTILLFIIYVHCLSSFKWGWGHCLASVWNFVERPRPYQDICTNLQWLRKSIDIRNFLVEEGLNEPTPGLNKRLYVNSRFKAADSSTLFANAFQRFQDTVNGLQHSLPTYWCFNLRPLYCQALSSFYTLGLICHPADKAAGPYVAPRGKYFYQGFTEHLSNKYNYVQ